MGESEPMRGTGDGCRRDCLEASSSLKDTVVGALPELALPELSRRPLRECVKRRLRGLGKTPVKEATEDPVKAKGAVGDPGPWNNHLRVPIRQVRGCSPKPPLGKHVEH